MALSPLASWRINTTIVIKSLALLKIGQGAQPAFAEIGSK
jgi:hypothetical protein